MSKGKKTEPAVEPKPRYTAPSNVVQIRGQVIVREKSSDHSKKDI